MATRTDKTIFIIITRGFIARNILRSGVLEELKGRGFSIIIFFVSIRNKPLPDYLRKEFEDGQRVIVETVPVFKNKFLYSRFGRFVSKLVYNKERRAVRYRIHGGYHTAKLFFERSLFTLLGRSNLLKRLARFVEERVFLHGAYAKHFERYNPSIVFTTSIISGPDIEFMKEAKRRGIRTASMPRGWDNITTRLYRFVPDRLFVQNALMKTDAVRLQHVAPEKILTTGFPQFDWYRRPEILMSREDFFKHIGLDPSRRLILFGSSGVWFEHDRGIGELLGRFVNSQEIHEPASLLVRAHFTDVKANKFQAFKEYQNVALDENHHASEFFYDYCDPTHDVIRSFVNTIHHADIVVVFCSTMTLDALCLDKPTINIAFGLLHDKEGRDITMELYKSDYYQPVLEHDSVDLVRDEKELMESINLYLKNPKRKAENRKRALDTLCYKVDGTSSRRLADGIASLL